MAFCLVSSAEQASSTKKGTSSKSDPGQLMLKFISVVGYICILLAILSSVLSLAASLASQLLTLGLVLVFGALIANIGKDSDNV